MTYHNRPQDVKDGCFKYKISTHCHSPTLFYCKEISSKYFSLLLRIHNSMAGWKKAQELPELPPKETKSADGTIVPERAKGNVSRGHRANVAKRDHGYYARTYVPLRHQGKGFSKKMDPRIREIPWAMGERQ
jgi:hypothetical protein